MSAISVLLAAREAPPRAEIEQLAAKVADLTSPNEHHHCSRCAVLLDCQGSMREHEWVWHQRAVKAEGELSEARAEIARLVQERRKVEQLFAEHVKRHETADSHDCASVEEALDLWRGRTERAEREAAFGEGRDDELTWSRSIRDEIIDKINKAIRAALAAKGDK